MWVWASGCVCMPVCVSPCHVCVFNCTSCTSSSALILMLCNLNVATKTHKGFSPLLTTDMINYVCFMRTWGLKWCCRLNQLRYRQLSWTDNSWGALRARWRVITPLQGRKWHHLWLEAVRRAQTLHVSYVGLTCLTHKSEHHQGLVCIDSGALLELTTSNSRG